MKNYNRFIFRASAVSLALMTVYGGARADEVAEFSKPDSTITFGAGSWSNDRPQRGIYDGMRDKGGYLLLDADINKRDDTTGTWYNFKAQSVGLDTREFRADVQRQGDIGGVFEYSKLVRENPYTINTGLQGIGGETLTVGTTQGGSFTKRDVKLGTEREMMRLSFFKTLMPGLEFKVDFKNEEKTGTRQWGWGSAALFSVEPIDSTTRQMEVVLQYVTKTLQLSGGYVGSWYDNHRTMVREQLNGITGGTNASFNSMTPMSLPLDNQAHQLFLDGGYAISPTTRATFNLSFSRATQDEALPSYGLTGANARFVGTPSHLNGKIDTTLMQLGLTARPLPNLSVVASLRYYDQDDKTPLKGFVGSNTTGIASVYNTPHSFETTTGKLEATYRLPEGFNLTGGVDYSKQDRSYPTLGSTYVPFRSSLDETSYRLELRRALADDLNGSLAYLHSERDGSSYILAQSGGVPEEFENEINPLHIADRKRDRLRLSMDWTPTDKLSLQFRVEDGKDRYPDKGRPYGMKSGNARLYGIDGNYVITPDWTLSAWYSYDLTKAREESVRAPNGSSVMDAEKSTHLKEVGDSFGLNLKGKVSPKLEMGLGVDWFRSTSSYPQDVTLVGTAVAFPATGVSGAPLRDIKNNMLRLSLEGKYALDKTSDLRIAFIHERWRTDDWSWNFAGGSPFSYYTGTNTCTGCSATPVGLVDGTTVNGKGLQKASFISAQYIYKFQ